MENEILDEIRKVRDEHAKGGISINQLVTSAMGEKLAALEGLSRLEQRAQRGKLVDIDRILAKVPATEPLPGDQ